MINEQMKTINGHGKVTGDIIAELKGMLGDKNIVTGEGTENYERDETLRAVPFPSEVVVKPGDPKSVSSIMKLASRYKIPVTPRGAGTGLSGGAVPIHGGIVLSLERMNSLIDINTDNFTAEAEAGAVLADVHQAVLDKGLYYPLYPGEMTATIGGNVATNAGGMRAVKYGVTRHFVLGLEAVLPTGEVIKTGGKYVKCATAYDLTQLLVGSEGTLAVITGVILRLISPPASREILFVPFNSLWDAISTVPEILKEKILPVGIEFLEKDILDMTEKFTGKEIPMHDYPAYLMIMLEADNQEQFLTLADRIGKVCLKNGAVDIFIPGSERAKRNLLEAREKFYPSLKHYGMLEIADVVVPRSRIAEFVEESRNITAQKGLKLNASGHAGDGNVHLHLMGQDTEANFKKAKECLLEFFKLGVSMEGTISGEHGLGYAKKEYLPLAANKAKLELMKRIKNAFDPLNIMNPGKVID
ncbi:FAD-binding oxidoreductase [Chloroflexota bacterium]